MTREPSEAAVVLAEFNEFVRKASAVPSTDQGRLDRGEVYVLLDRLRTAVNRPPVEVAGLLDELDEPSSGRSRSRSRTRFASTARRSTTCSIRYERLHCAAPTRT